MVAVMDAVVSTDSHPCSDVDDLGVVQQLHLLRHTRVRPCPAQPQLPELRGTTAPPVRWESVLHWDC